MMLKPEVSPTIVPVILSGGSGTRLWPVSRKSYPKQFWPLISGAPLLAETALRATGPGFTSPLVVANQEHRFIIAEQLRDAGIETPRILLEPVGRNSAPAIAAAALLVAQTDPQAVLWIMAADASINNQPALHEALNAAVAAARQGYIATFGMQPNRPETGYGYILQGLPVQNLPGVFHLDRFVEKPDLAQAAAMIAEKTSLWNSGMFVFRADILIEEMRSLAPDILVAAQNAIDDSTSDLDFIRLCETAFSAAPNISFDYAIAEKTHKAVVIPASVGWSDVGSWAALANITPHDDEGNSAHGDVLLENTQNSYVRSDGILTTLLGVKDLIVVTTQDAVLVTHKDETQNVKKIVDLLKERNRPEAEMQYRSYRPWGFYESLIQGDRFQVKRIVVMPGRQLSLQKHFHRAEHWVVVAGSALVTRDAERILVRENESVYLPLGCVHRLENPGRIPFTLIEVQSGSYLGEDDIVRLEDNYGRN